jgi:hypothetical protein
LFGIDYERKNRLYFLELQQERRKQLLRTSQQERELRKKIRWEETKEGRDSKLKIKQLHFQFIESLPKEYK